MSHIGVYADEVDVCETKNGYELYECRAEKVCEPYESEKPVFDTEEYLEASEYLDALDTNESSAFEVLEEVKSQYRNNIGTIYSCAMIQAQRNSLNLIEKELLGFNKSWKLDDIIGRRIDVRERKLESAAKKLECNTSTDKKSIYNKQNILKETTSEACTYVTYLEYLKEYYDNIPNVLWVNEEDATSSTGAIKVYSTAEIWNLITSIETSIDQEIEQTYKVFPIAFQAYTEYENNYPLHFLLEVIREDFVLLRKSLHQALMPIAQVWYKIINAMIK